MSYADLYQRSIDEPRTYWAEQARLIDWHRPFAEVLDNSRAPFARWFVGGQTSLCHNALDRWLDSQGDATALIAVTTELGDGNPRETVYSFRQLHAEVMTCAAMLLSLGVERGQRVLLYMPMIAEASIAMLACARIGAVHSVVFGGFAANSLATRIDDARPVLILSADAGSRNGKPIPYKPLLDQAMALAHHKPAHVLMVDRGLASMKVVEGRDVDYGRLRQRHLGAEVPVTWLEATDSSYILYTSGTTGTPKGVQRDVGGYAVALAASMQNLFCGQPKETFFCTSDIGWVVGHSYIVYGPLIAGMATVMYEGLPLRPDAGIWWSLVEKYRITRMFSAPTAIRVLKKQPPEFMGKYDLSSLKALYLAGEPLDETTSDWIAKALGVPVIDNYWQTESGWPILSIARGIDDRPSRLGSPGVPMPGYKVRIVDDATGADCQANRKGVLVIDYPLPPGCLQTVHGDDARYESTYWAEYGQTLAYSTFDWGIRDQDGYYFILGRTDDVINVAGHRLGTREIEECVSSHANVSEVAVVGVQDATKGQAAMAFVVARNPAGLDDPVARQRFEAQIMSLVDAKIGALARPARVVVIGLLPKTRSGKLLRRVIQAICEGRDTGDVSMIDDPASLVQIRQALGQGG
ncbi:MAG: propionate--CoA ligase [Janthinobacterium lividum]